MNGFKELRIENSRLNGVEFGYKFEYRETDGPDDDPHEPALWLHVSIRYSDSTTPNYLKYVLYRTHWDHICGVTVDDPSREGDLFDEEGEGGGNARNHILKRARNDIGRCENIEQLKNLEVKIAFRK
jgi:hypothetical protein